MALRYEIFPESNLIFMIAWGVLTDEDAMNSLKLFQDKRFRPGMNQLNVYSKVERFDVSTEVISKTVNIVANLDEI